ncbi:MAG: hypothetical protein EKK45_10895 [Curvibacter sp.]|nr:MAG: hypothetical protein EKK45_10895 [Curvibacter sp.]
MHRYLAIHRVHVQGAAVVANGENPCLRRSDQSTYIPVVEC